MADSFVKKVSIIILNYNGKRLLEHFLWSVKKLNYPNFEVVILDNGSTDDSVEFLTKYFPEFIVFKSQKNLGFSEGCNVAVQHASGDYLLFVANDMELDSNFINELIEVMESDPTIGVCTGKTLKIDSANKRTNLIDNLGGDVDVLGFASPRAKNKVNETQKDLKSPVFFAYGCPSMIKRQVFIKVGGFDSDYFALYEDLDICWRIRLAGYKVCVNPLAVSYHKVSVTVNSIFKPSKVRFLAEKNILRTLTKNYSISTLVRILPQYFAILSSETMFYLLIKRVDMASATVKSIIWNIRHLRSCLLLRAKAQEIRVINDKTIQKGMIKKSIKVSILKQWLLGMFPI